MALNPPAPFGGGIKSKAVDSSLSCESSSPNISYFSFGSPASASAVSKKIFEIKATEDNTKITKPMLSGSGKNILSFGSIRASP